MTLKNGHIKRILTWCCALGWLCALGCRNPAQFSLNVSCADAEALRQVTRIVVRVTAARDRLCEQFNEGQLDPASVEVLSQITIDRTRENGGTLPQLPAVDMVFLAEGYAEDQVTLRGCSLVRYRADQAHEVFLELFVLCKSDGDCKDGDGCTKDTCARGQCQFTAITTDPTCVSGQQQTCEDPATCPVPVSDAACQGHAGECRQLDSACQVGECDPVTGTCAARPRPDGLACDDQSACTLNDTCQAGQCKGTAKSCSQLDDVCHTATCDPATGQCAAQTKPDGTTCNDNLYCTVSDRCLSGQCKGTAKDCSSVADACSTGVYSESAKACQKILKADPNASYVETTGLTKYACSSYPGIGSCDSLISTSITFTNPSPVSMNIYWLDYSGGLALYGTLSAGQSMGMGSYYTHPWLIRDVCGNCMTLYVKGTPCWY